ncbi:phage antirepressor N-terminal domain-containing protein [Proteus terrae]|uniref:phage antirepressor N-terminal domain-containing protein n=1 Tax=Proteus terrae TaxID=1574161 RepID=UPI0034D68F0B
MNKNNDKYNFVHINMVVIDKELRNILCMALKKLNGWLLRINSSKVKEGIRNYSDYSRNQTIVLQLLLNILCLHTVIVCS